MKTKIAINGFGRIGRNAFKIAYERSDLEIVAVNDLSDTKTLAHLLKHDTNYGEYQHNVTSDEENIIVEGQKVKLLSEKDPAQLPWRDLAVDVVIESTGLFVEPDKAKAHITAGAKKVIISAPAKGEGSTTVILGVNEDALKQAGEIINNGSCTTNCVAPVMAVLEENFGVQKAMMTTVHSYTASQKLQDAPAKDLREARNAASNIVPTTTGASISVAQALPVVEGLFEGLSIRVPTPVVSLIDMVVLTKKETSMEEVNEVFKKAAGEPYYQGILAVSEEELVSTDYIGNSHSAIVDLGLTHVVTGNLVKVVAWYDNEWGYSNRLIELTADVGAALRGDQAGGSEHRTSTSAEGSSSTVETPVGESQNVEVQTEAPTPEKSAELKSDFMFPGAHLDEPDEPLLEAPKPEGESTSSLPNQSAGDSSEGDANSRSIDGLSHF